MTDGGGLDPSITGAIATISAAIATAILQITTRFVSYRWPRGRNRHDDEMHHHAEHREPDEEDEDE